jgi:hypothetical protein
MAAKTSINFMLFLVACLCVSNTTASLLINSGQFANVTLRTGQYYWKGDDLNSIFDPLTAQLAEASMADLTGRIVFQPFVGSRDWLAQVKYLQEQGAVAILYGTASLVPGQYGCALTAAEPTGQILIPIAEISQNEFDQIRNALLAGDVIDATLTSEGNEWNFLGSIAVIIVFRVIFTCCASGLIGYALYKMIMFIRFRGPQFNVSQVCLALEIIANLWRIVYFAVDPFACFGNYGISTSFFTTVSFPYEVATFALITFYWYEVMTNAEIKVYTFLNRCKPFFFSFTIGFIVAALLVTVLGLVLAFSVTTPIIVFYVAVSLGFLIFYIITLLKIMKQIKNSTHLRASRTITVEQVNKKIILNGVIRVVSLVPVIIFVAPHIATVPVPQYIASIFIYALIMLDSWARIYLFKEPSKEKKTKTTTNNVLSLSSPRNIKLDNEATNVHV